MISEYEIRMLLENSFSSKELDEYMPDLFKIYRSAGKNADSLFSDVLPLVKVLINTRLDLLKVGQELVQLSQSYMGASNRLSYHMRKVKRLFSTAEFKEYWPGIVKLAVSTVGPNVRFFSDRFAKLKNLFTPNEFKDCWPDIVNLGQLAGMDIWIFFEDVLPGMKEKFTPDEFKDFLSDLVKLCYLAGNNADSFLRFGLHSVDELICSWKDFLKWKKSLERLLKTITAYNGSRVFRELYTSGILKFITRFEKGDPKDHFDFFIDLFEKNKRIGLLIWECLFEAIKKRHVPVLLNAQIKKEISFFITQTNGFNTDLWVLFKKEGEEGLQQVKRLAKEGLEDQLSKDQIDEAVNDWQKKGYSVQGVALGMTQMAVPTSGASFVLKREVIGLWSKMMSVGDLREHVPQALRGTNLGYRSIDKIEYVLRLNEVFDDRGEIKDLIDKLTYPDASLNADQRMKESIKDQEVFAQALRDYLGKGTEDNKEKIMPLFYQWVRHNDLLKEKIERVMPQEYSGLELLEQLFNDKDALLKEFRKVLKNVNNKVREVSKKISDPEGLKKEIQNVWKNKDLTNEVKVTALGGLLNPYDEVSIREKLIFLIKDEQLRMVVAELTSRKSKEQINVMKLIEELFAVPLEIIRNEKNKFDVNIRQENFKIKIKAVKGPIYGVWGLLAGVCIATDIELWKDKNFYLLAIIDEAKGQAVGFIHMYEKMIHGKKILTVPGIEPSVEFLGEVKPKDVYSLIEEALRNVAKRAGYGAVYLPTSETILSNRSDINKLVLKKGYVKTMLSQAVQWNSLPEPYPFKEVYILQ